MTSSEGSSGKGVGLENPEKAKLAPAAQRALAEAEARRKERESQAKPAPKEINGRKGPDPARYGDWEKKGIAIDF